METEYAFSARDRAGRPMNPGPLVEQMERLATQITPTLPGMRSAGIFLANGSRLYRDPAGGFTHLEIAGPECRNPWDVVRYLRAGEAQLVELAAALRRANASVAEAAFCKTNIDYSGAQTTWGCHESYLTSRPVLAASRNLIPHLVTRTVFSGAGGFNTRAPGIEFLLSPRAAHFTTIENAGSQSERPIFHTRDEPLCEGHRRLHVICGESLCSERAAWLKVATTAAIIALADADLKPGEAVQFENPVEALHIFARDPSCRSRAPLADGRTVTALDVQRHYLALAERHADADFMPAFWTKRLCEEWRATLDLLEQGPEAVARSLDWAIKLPLFRGHAARRGFAWETLPVWNEALRRLHLAARERFAAPAGNDPPVVVPGTQILQTDAVQAILAAPPGPGLDWAQLPALLKLRQELFEIDWRFGQIGEGSLFAQLDSAGVLDHHFDGVDNIAHAQQHPPDFGRAKLRGEVIRRVAHVREHFAADWKGVFDLGAWVMLDLNEPFVSEELWRNISPLRSLGGPQADPENVRLMAELI
jgi:hypothetical protein